MIKYFDFETEIENIDQVIFNLNKENPKNIDKISKLNKEKNNLYKKIYSNLNAWQKVQVSRHNDRPHTLDYVKIIFDDLIFLHGDKKFADDSAIVGCLAKINSDSVMIIGTEKGNTMESRLSIILVWLNQKDIEKHKD